MRGRTAICRYELAATKDQWHACCRSAWKHKGKQCRIAVTGTRARVQLQHRDKEHESGAVNWTIRQGHCSCLPSPHQHSWCSTVCGQGLLHTPRLGRWFGCEDHFKCAVKHIPTVRL